MNDDVCVKSMNDECTKQKHKNNNQTTIKMDPTHNSYLEVEEVEQAGEERESGEETVGEVKDLGPLAKVHPALAQTTRGESTLEPGEEVEDGVKTPGPPAKVHTGHVEYVPTSGPKVQASSVEGPGAQGPLLKNSGPPGPETDVGSTPKAKHSHIPGVRVHQDPLTEESGPLGSGGKSRAAGLPGKQVNSLGYKKLQDFTRSDDGKELTKERSEACGLIIDPDPQLSTGGLGGRQKKMARRRSQRPGSGLVLRSRGEGDDPPLGLEELSDCEAAAWTITRDASSTTTFVTLVDTGNQAVSCLPVKLYKQLCRQGRQRYDLETYKAPVVGVGSRRIQVYGRFIQPLTLYFEDCHFPIKVRPIVIGSKAEHLNLGIRDLAKLDLSLHLSREGNWVQRGNSWIKLHSKREAVSAAGSQDPNLLAAYLNNCSHSKEEEVSELELMQQGMAERRLKSMASSDRVLCKNQGFYQWSNARVAIGDPRPMEMEKRKMDMNGKQEMEWMDKQLKKVSSENREEAMYRAHVVRPWKPTLVPARTFMYLPCKTTFPFGTDFLCAPVANQELPLLVARCVMTRTCPDSLVHVPVYNLTDDDVKVGPNNHLAHLQAGEVEAVEEIAGSGSGENELVPGGEGEMQRCGDFTFPITVKSEQGHLWLPPEGGGLGGHESREPVKVNVLPNFSREELDKAEQSQRLEYQLKPPGKQEEEEGLEKKKIKMREALLELEKLPKKDGEWIRGEVRELGDLEEEEVHHPAGRKLKIEDAPDHLVRKLFEDKLKLGDNEYVNQFPPKIREEMSKEIIDMMMKGRSAFSAGEQGNEFDEQIGDCDWFEYKLVLKEPYRDTIFYQKPKVLSRDDTNALRDLLQDWLGKGLIRKNNPTVGKQGSPHSLPLFLVKKKTSSGTGVAHRAILDARRLNSASIHRQVYMGSVQANLASLEKGDLYTNLDIASFFNSIRLSETPAPGHTYSSVDYCSFQTHSLGSFSFLRAAQGLHQSTSLASWIMDRLARDFPLDIVKHFADDIMIVCKDDQWVRELLEERAVLLRGVEVQEEPEGDKCASNGRGRNEEEKRRETKKKAQCCHELLNCEKCSPGSKNQEKPKCSPGSKNREKPKCSPGSKNRGEPSEGRQTHPRSIGGPTQLSPSTLDIRENEMAETLANWRQVTAGGKMIETLQLLLGRIKEAGLRLQLKKCEWFARKITWLGFDISREGIQIPEKLKMELLNEMPPSSPAGLANYLGRILYFRQHIPGLSHFTARLHEAAARSPKDWKLKDEELEDYFLLKRAFLESTAIGFVDHDNLKKNKLKVFLDWSCLGISALVTQTQEFMDQGAKVEKEVLVGSISRKCPPSLRNASSCRGEAAALNLALSTFSNILKHNHFLLHSDHLSLLYLKGLKSMNGQLWRLFEEIAKFSFTMFHVKHRDNGLADASSRRTDLPELTEEEKELFGDIIEEFQPEIGHEPEPEARKRQKGEPRERVKMTREQELQTKRQQLKQLFYAKRLNHGLPLSPEQAEIGEAVNLEGGWLWGGGEGGRHHHLRPTRPIGLTQTTEEGSLKCATECQHQRGWLPGSEGRLERVCISRLGEENCDEVDDWSREKPGEQSEKSTNPIIAAAGGRLRGTLEDCISPEEMVLKQKEDPLLGKVYEFVKRSRWPDMKNMRQRFFHPEVIKLFNIKEVLVTDAFGVLCRQRVSPEEGRELKICLPYSLRDLVFRTCHLADAIHRGIDATVKAISDRYFYLGMNEDLRARILRCGACFTAKLPAPKGNSKVPELNSVLLQGCADFNHTVAADTSGRLPACNHSPPHRYFALMVDCATGFVATMSMSDKTGGSMVYTFNQAWTSIFHAPSFLRLDRGSEFMNKKFLSMLEANGTQVVFTMAGAARALYAERMNRNVKQTLRAVLSTCQDQSGWCEALPYVTGSLNTSVNKSTGFSAYKLVFGKNASTPLDNIICAPQKRNSSRPMLMQDPSDALCQHAVNRNEELKRLQERHFFDGADEIEKAKARSLMFNQLRENRIQSLARTADVYTHNSHPLFPLRQSQDENRLVYVFSDRIPKGKSQSLTSRWLGPAKIISVISNILAIVQTQYREEKFGQPEKTQACTIDRLYPFHSSHAILCDADAGDERSLVSTQNNDDYRPKDDEASVTTDENDGDAGNLGDPTEMEYLEELANDLADIGHVLTDEFCELPRPDPLQQIQLTNQTHIPFKSVWASVQEVDDRLLLNDILPPGIYGERWQSPVTRAELASYNRETGVYEDKKLDSPDVPDTHALNKHVTPSGPVSGTHTADLNDEGETGLALDVDDSESTDEPDTTHDDENLLSNDNEANNVDNSTSSENPTDHNTTSSNIRNDEETQRKRQREKQRLQQPTSLPVPHSQASQPTAESRTEAKKQELHQGKACTSIVATDQLQRPGRERCKSGKEGRRRGEQHMYQHGSAQRDRVESLPDERRREGGRGRGGGSANTHVPRLAPPRRASSRPRPSTGALAEPELPTTGRTATPSQLGASAFALQQHQPEDSLPRPQGRGWRATPPSSPPLDQQSPIDWSKINRGASQVTSAIDKAKANIEQQQPRQQQKSMLARLKSHLGEGSYWRQQQHQQQQSSDFSTTTARQSGPTAQKTTQESNYQPSPAAAAGQGSGQACQPASQPASEPGTSRRGPPREAKTAGSAWLKTLRKTKQ